MTERLDSQSPADKPSEPENRFGIAVGLLLKASDWMERNDPEVKKEIDAFLETVHPLECGPLATTEVARSAGTRIGNATEDGPLGSWRPVGSDAVELDFMLTQYVGLVYLAYPRIHRDAGSKQDAWKAAALPEQGAADD